MQNFMLIKNSFVKASKEQGQDKRPIETGLTTKLKTTRRVQPRLLDSNVYGQHVLFQVPKDYQNLSQVFIKMTLSTGGTALPKSQLASRIFKNVIIRSADSGCLLQDIRPLYTLVRYDELSQTNYQNYLQNAMDPNQVFDANTVTLYLPLFAFFSEHQALYLKTRNMEALEIECITNDSAALMGLSSELTETAFEALFVYYDVPDFNSFKSKTGNELYYEPIPQSIDGTFDCFYEEPVAVSTGATSATMTLRVPDPVYSLHFAVIDPDTQFFVPIDSFVISMAGQNVVEMDTRVNFTLATKDEVGFVDGSVVSYWFSEERSRYTNTGLLALTDSFFPTKLTVNFEATTSDCEFHVFAEVRTKIDISKEGKLTRIPLGSLRLRTTFD